MKRREKEIDEYSSFFSNKSISSSRDEQTGCYKYAVRFEVGGGWWGLYTCIYHYEVNVCMAESLK